MSGSTTGLRPEFSRRRMLAAQAAVVTVGSALLAEVAREGCVDPGPPIDRVEPQMPRGHYCAVVHGSEPWLLLVAVPLAAFVICARWIRRPVQGWLTVGVLMMLAAANVITELSLAFVPNV